MFRELCLKNGFVNKKNVSHVLMDGGVLSVPFDRLDFFYDICVQCIKSGEPIFVVEQKTDIYNFFVDVDFNHDRALEMDDILKFSKTIFFIVNKFADGDYPGLVSTSEPKPKGTKIKTGIHINFPGLIVNKKSAINLMYHIINGLSEEIPGYDWFRFIDPSVYGSLENNSKGSGFRMPWSHKRSKHEECKGNGCGLCENSGRFTEGMYLPICVYTKHEEKIIKQDPDKNILWLSTIRSNKNESDVTEVPEAVSSEKIPKSVSPRQEGGFTKNQTKNEIYDAELKAILETFIRKYLEGQEKAKVCKIFKNSNSYAIQTNSKYCENLKRSHGSNHIWFYINGKDKTICQKCFCRCDTTEGRRHGLCKDFSGRKSLLNSKLNEIMFNNIKKKKCSNGYLFQ
jgi:hypothetical protein